MRRRDGPADGRAGDQTVDPLDEALRQIGAEMLDEPIPDRLRQVLRQARGDSEAEPDKAAGERSEKTDRR